VRVVAHWSTADNESGTRSGVDAATAMRQARRCARRPVAAASTQRRIAVVGAGRSSPGPPADD
jgi:hypothetical protein